MLLAWSNDRRIISFKEFHENLSTTKSNDIVSDFFSGQASKTYFMYVLEACLLKKSDIRSLDFVVDRNSEIHEILKFFKTNNTAIIRSCQKHFCFKLITQ